jgi:hypothetical protein
MTIAEAEHVHEYADLSCHHGLDGQATPLPATQQFSGEQHEHACVRCALLRPDPAQRFRLLEIRDNLEARIIEAKREGWLGEVEGLQVSLTGAKDKIAQIDAMLQRETTALGMPSFGSISGRPFYLKELTSDLANWLNHAIGATRTDNIYHFADLRRPDQIVAFLEQIGERIGLRPTDWSARRGRGTASQLQRRQRQACSNRCHRSPGSHRHQTRYAVIPSISGRCSPA